MNFENINNKQLGLIERLSRELLDTLRRCKLNEETIYNGLLDLEQAARKERQQRFDEVDQPFKGH